MKNAPANTPKDLSSASEGSPSGKNVCAISGAKNPAPCASAARSRARPPHARTPTECGKVEPLHHVAHAAQRQHHDCARVRRNTKRRPPRVRPPHALSFRVSGGGLSWDFILAAHRVAACLSARWPRCAGANGRVRYLPVAPVLPSNVRRGLRPGSRRATASDGRGFGRKRGKGLLCAHCGGGVRARRAGCDLRGDREGGGAHWRQGRPAHLLRRLPGDPERGRPGVHGVSGQVPGHGACRAAAVAGSGLTQRPRRHSAPSTSTTPASASLRSPPCSSAATTKAPTTCRCAWQRPRRASPPARAHAGRAAGARLRRLGRAQHLLPGRRGCRQLSRHPHCRPQRCVGRGQGTAARARVCALTHAAVAQASSSRTTTRKAGTSGHRTATATCAACTTCGNRTCSG